MFVFCNPNPERNLVGDCVIRAISIALNQDWQTTYLGVTVKGFEFYDMPSSNNVWGAYLEEKGFERFSIPNTCPNCYTIKDFCKDNPTGIYIIGTGSHAVAIIDGDYYDTWDSGDEVPIYFFERKFN